MTKRLRAVLLAGAAGAALATAGSAWASYTPKLLVKAATGATNGQVTVTATVGATDDATARAQIYVPAGYTVATDAAAGTNLGAVIAKASAADLGGQILTLTGNLLVIAPNPTAQQECGVASAAATWDLHMSAAGQTLDIPMFVVPNTGAEASVAPTKLVVCLTSPDLPNGNPLRAPFGAKLISAQFTSSAIPSPTTQGTFRWTSLWTPYTPGTGNPNAAGTVETQALVRLPSGARITGLKRIRHVTTHVVRVKGKKVTRRTVTTTVSFTTTVTEAGAGVAGARVTAKVDGRSLGAKTTGATGTATFSFSLARGRAAVSVAAAIPDRDLGAAGCTATAAFGGLPCVDAMSGGSTHLASTSVTAYTR